MVPPEGERANRLPTLAWKSVVSDAPESDTTVPAPPAVEPSTPLVPPSVPLPDLRGDDSPMATPPMAPSPVDPPVRGPISFAPLSLDIAAPESPDPPIPIVMRPATLRAFAPRPVVPAVEDSESVAGDADVVSDELPLIREATPVPDLDSRSSDIAGLASDEVGVVATVESGPHLPPVPQPDHRRAAAPSPVDLAAQAAPATTSHRARRRSRRGLKLFATLVVLGGLVAAAIVFGRPLLFPDDWDSSAVPYADTVEAVRGVEFVEPLTVISEPTADYLTHLAGDLAVIPSEVQPQWRALGLLSGASATAETVQALAGWRAAFYSPVDGQVYADAGATDAERDPQIVQAMTAAALDQDLGWSTDHPNRTLDDRAATTAEVLRRSVAVQADSDFDGEVSPLDPTLAAALPPIIAYELTAPYLFAEFANPVADGEDPLYRLGTEGPGPLLPRQPRPASPAMMTGDDVAAEGPQAMDRSFWYLSFAAFLDPTQAYAASEAIVENSLTMAERGEGHCIYATFSGGGVDATVTLRGALEAWTAAAPAEFSSGFSVLADGTLQLVSCDPGAAFVSPINPDAARSLLAWRAAELAVIDTVSQDPSAVVADAYAFAWPFVAGSTTAADLAALPASTPLADVADAARDAVTTIFTPAE